MRGSDTLSPMALRVLAILWLLTFCQGAGAAEAILRVERAQVVEVAGSDAPPDDADWLPVDLPHRWAGPSDGAPADRWYRFEVSPRLRPGELCGVLVPDLAMNGVVYWNGIQVGDGGRLTPPISQNFHSPLYFRVPSALVQEGVNEVQIRVVAAPHFYGWLGPVEIGADAVLSERFARQRLWRRTAPLATTVLGGVIVALAGSFWLASREPLYAWFALSVASSTFAGLNLHVRDLPVPTQVWARAIQAGVALSPVFLVFFAHRLAGVRRPGAERGLAGLGLCILLGALVLPSRWVLPVFTGLHVVSLGVGLYAVGVMAAHLARSGRGELRLLAATGAVLLLIAGHDTAVQFGDREGAPRYGNALALPTLFLGFGSLVTFRFVRAFRRVERQNEELEERVRDKHEELEAQFVRLRGLEGERARNAERERIMREMHDGLGGRLVETLSVVEDGGASRAEIASSLRGALDEMRLLIDSLDPLVQDLPTLLATIRNRLEPSLRRRGIELAWAVDPLPTLDRWAPGELLHVMRIVQEALTNVLRHAGARRVTLSARLTEAGVRIEIADDGQGIHGAAAGGRGLRNMRERARALGGSLEIRSDPRGTTVCLEVPAQLDPRTAAGAATP